MQVRYDLTTHKAETFKTDVAPAKLERIKFSFIYIYEKPTLEARKVTKLLKHDMTSSNDDLPSYAQSIKLVSTTSTTHSVKNDTPAYMPKERRCLILSTKED